MNDLVSINIVTHNRAQYIGDAVRSILSQDYENWEIIIIDDCSTDNTKNIVKDFTEDERIKYYLVNKQKNISAVRNIALGYSQGQYIAVLDSDDMWCDNTKLSKQVNFFKENPEYVVVGSSAIAINEENKEIDKILKPVTDKEIRDIFLTKNPFMHSSVVFNRKIVYEVGKYNEGISYGEDFDLFLRLGKVGKLYNLPNFFIKYRIHEGNEASKHTFKAIFDVFKIINKNRKSYNISPVIYLQKIFKKFFEIIKK